MEKNYGIKGGSSATSGRRSEVIVGVIGSQTFRKRVFLGQRFLTVIQKDENDKPLVQAWQTREEATNYALSGSFEVEMILDATVESAEVAESK